MGVFVAVGLFFHGVRLEAQEAMPKNRPNVLFIISDDQGFGDFGFNGNKMVQTPVLDQLATDSALFKSFAVTPACSPSRISFYTGRNHFVTGVWGVPPRANPLPDEIRMPAFFKSQGYRTLHVGKLDCVIAGKEKPTAFGWEEWMGGGGYEQKDPMIYGSSANRKMQGWTCDLYTDATIDYVTRHANEPWFVSLAYIIPHLPWECEEKYKAPFLAKGCSPSLADCYGSIAQMDANIGRLLEALRKTGQSERTIVVFVSDNGATSKEAHKQAESNDGYISDKDWEIRNVAKLRGCKAGVWENGIRVPLIVSWPGRIVKGERAQFGGAEDILPTMLDLAGIDTKSVPHLPWDGVSLVPALLDSKSVFQRPELFRMVIWGEGGPVFVKGSPELPDEKNKNYEEHHLTLRGAVYKFHTRPGGGKLLFNIQEDPGERKDISAENPEIVAQMDLRCRQQWEELVSSGRAFLPGEKKK